MLQSIKVRIRGCYCSAALVRVVEDGPLGCRPIKGNEQTVLERNGRGNCVITRKPFTVLVMIAVCVLSFGPFRVVAEPISTTTTVSIGEMSINLSYSSEEGVLRASYSTDDKECQLTLFSTQRMGLLIEVAGVEITFSLKFLEEGEVWPEAEALEEGTYALRSRFEISGWVVVVVQRPEQGGETG